MNENGIYLMFPNHKFIFYLKQNKNLCKIQNIFSQKPKRDVSNILSLNKRKLGTKIDEQNCHPSKEVDFTIFQSS